MKVRETGSFSEHSGTDAIRFRFIYSVLVALFVLLLGLGIAIGFLFDAYRCQCTLESKNNSVIEYDTSAKVFEGLSAEDMTAKLNEMVDAGMIRISIDPSPVFEDGSQGVVNIYNHPTNRYPQIVELILDETGESLYKSKAIPVGTGVESIRLSSQLADGVYDCTAYFTAVDADTAASVGTAGAKVRLTVGKV